MTRTHDAGRAEGLARLLPAVDAYLGENAPLILFRADELAFLSAAGSEAVCMKRPVYDVRTLTGRTSESLCRRLRRGVRIRPRHG